MSVLNRPTTVISIAALLMGFSVACLIGYATGLLADSGLTVQEDSGFPASPILNLLLIRTWGLPLVALASFAYFRLRVPSMNMRLRLSLIVLAFLAGALAGITSVTPVATDPTEAGIRDAGITALVTFFSAVLCVKAPGLFDHPQE